MLRYGELRENIDVRHDNRMTYLKPHISTLITYFTSELPKLKKNYKWRIPQIDGFEKSGEKGYLANIELKKYFNEKWMELCNEERVALSKIIVSDWGGVKNNHRKTLESYVTEIESDNPSTPIKGIASYSKIFSVTDLNEYAIYDARVAVSLNAIQWNAKLKKGIAFNYIPGRNNITGHAGKRIGFAYQDQFKVKNLVKYGWIRLKRDETYCCYMDVLTECLKHFHNFKLYDLEMVLFANAETECRKAMEVQSNT